MILILVGRFPPGPNGFGLPIRGRPGRGFGTIFPDGSLIFPLGSLMAPIGSFGRVGRRMIFPVGSLYRIGPFPGNLIAPGGGLHGRGLGLKPPGLYGRPGRPGRRPGLTSGRPVASTR